MHKSFYASALKGAGELLLYVAHRRRLCYVYIKMWFFTLLYKKQFAANMYHALYMKYKCHSVSFVENCFAVLYQKGVTAQGFISWKWAKYVLSLAFTSMQHHIMLDWLSQNSIR